MAKNCCKIHKWSDGYSCFSLFACDSLRHHSSGSMWNMRQPLLFRLSELKHPSAKHPNTLTTGLWRIITTAIAHSFVWATHGCRKTCPITNVANVFPGESNTVDVWFGFPFQYLLQCLSSLLIGVLIYLLWWSFLKINCILCILKMHVIVHFSSGTVGFYT